MRTREASNVPSISNKELSNMYARIKPVVFGADLNGGLIKAVKRVAVADKLSVEEAVDLMANARDTLFYIEDVHPRKSSFTFEPKPTSVASDLAEMGIIYTHHRWGHFFRPTVAEVLAQIPEEYKDNVVAFITRFVNSSGDDHIGFTRLYGKATFSALHRKASE